MRRRLPSLMKPVTVAMAAAPARSYYDRFFLADPALAAIQKDPALRPLLDDKVRRLLGLAARMGWLDAQPRTKPVFMWLQYMEPHFPYVLPEPLAELDGEPCPDPVKAKMSDPDGPAPADVYLAGAPARQT